MYLTQARHLGSRHVRALVACLVGAAALFLPAGPGAASPDKAAPRDMLPNLVPFRTRSLSMGCDQYETLEQGARRCLRYDTVVANFGHGALELRYLVNSIATDQQLRQRIFRSDGSFREVVADTYVLHPTHAHFHYANFAQGHLWRSNAAGDRLGKKPVRSGKKAGFCLLDIEDHRRGTRYDQDARYTGLDACFPMTVEGTDWSQVNGLSVGWADVYGKGLTDQYIEVTDVPDGYYLLEVEVDPVDTVVELDDRDNSAFSLIRLQAPFVELLTPPEDKEEIEEPIPDMRVERVERRPYTAPALGFEGFGGSCLLYLSVGCTEIQDHKPMDRWIRVTIKDESGSETMARVFQYDEGGEGFFDEVFCGRTKEPVRVVDDVRTIAVQLYAGRCGQGTSLPTRGTAVFKLSNFR